MNNKYRARKTEVDGIIFDSKHEAEVYLKLKDRENKGEISNLQLQVPFELIPKIGKQRPCTYVADFTYYEGYKFMVVDAKGVKTDAYKIKKKLMRWINNIEITEL